jgi:hypothetical protein
MIGALEEARDERGSNFVYTEHYDQEGTCQYVAYDEDGNEGAACIAGNALHRLGVPLSVLKKMDVVGAGNSSEVISRRPVINLLLDAGFVLEAGARVAAEYAQSEQDSGRTWGEAVTTAIRVAGMREDN